MAATEPDWTLYRTLLAVLEEGSLSGAARALGSTQPTVGRQLAALERALAQKLFTRSQSGLAPTEAALAIRPYAEALGATAAALRRAATGSGAEPRGRVRISASEIVGAEVLPPILATLRDAHPGLAIELMLSNRVHDLLHRDADIAVRMMRPTQNALLARRIGTVAIGLHAHRRYLERHGTPATPAALEGHALIGYDREPAYVRGLGRDKVPVRREMFALASDSDIAQLAAIRAGFGIGFCQVPLGRRDPDLRRLFAAQVDFGFEVWVVMHEDLGTVPRCRAAFDALVEGLLCYLAAPGAPAPT
jgi:DNA-binding transcriptional LysR family regulator